MTEVTATTARIVIESKKQTFVLSVGEKINADLDEDGFAEISIKLDSVNSITKKASITIKRLTEKIAADKGLAETEAKQEEAETEKSYMWIIIVAVIVIIIAVGFFIWSKKRNRGINYRKLMRQ